MNEISTMRKTANILTLISAIWQTCLAAILTLFTFGILGLFTIPLVVLAWIAYNNCKKMSRGWTIYGLVQSVLCADLIGVVGYIFALVDLGDEGKNALQQEQEQLDQMRKQIEKLKLEQQLRDLKAQKTERNTTYGDAAAEAKKDINNKDINNDDDNRYITL